MQLAPLVVLTEPGLRMCQASRAGTWIKRRPERRARSVPTCAASDGRYTSSIIGCVLVRRRTVKHIVSKEHEAIMVKGKEVTPV